MWLVQTATGPSLCKGLTCGGRQRCDCYGSCGWRRDYDRSWKREKNNKPRSQKFELITMDSQKPWPFSTFSMSCDPVTLNSYYIQWKTVLPLLWFDLIFKLTFNISMSSMLVAALKFMNRTPETHPPTLPTHCKWWCCLLTVHSSSSPLTTLKFMITFLSLKTPSISTLQQYGPLSVRLTLRMSRSISPSRMSPVSR